ncbi:MAG TPA: hypothetical protein VJS13_03905 [Pyrinomonadaceae bacterium]|nr:hypothetical protein [Pyrinomonadaceae bacterium]
MLILLIILIFVYNFTAMFYQLAGLERLPTVEFLYIATLPCAVVWWFRKENVKSAVNPVYCQGLLASYGWIFMVPYHLVQTRGVKGLVPLFALLASYFGSQVLAVIFYFAFVADVRTY